MKKQILIFGLFALLITIEQNAQSTVLPNTQGCLVTKESQIANPNAKKEFDDFEKYTADYVATFSQEKILSGNCFVIPIVFHVYGTTQGGMPVTNAIIIDALDKMNQDFHGLNADYGTVHNNFLSIRSTMPDVIFALAEIDPVGNPTTGIVYHPVTAGYANGSGYDAAIAADAWDNYKYMNIYIMNDLFDDGVTNNSGYGYYPSTTMSNNNTARIVYNGAYLGINCTWEPEFASTLTHEYGHWLNLIHTFDGGCVAPNDYVNDTPPCDFSGGSYPCHATNTSNSPLNCNSDLINAENYMDYAGASGCYKMFSQGQVARMYAGLNHPSRQPLWQTSNLIATGVDHFCNTSGVEDYSSWNISIFPNPSSGTFRIRSKTGETFSVLSIVDVIGQKVNFTLASDGSSSNLILQLNEPMPGIYFVHVKQNNANQVYKLMVE